MTVTNPEPTFMLINGQSKITTVSHGHFFSHTAYIYLATQQLQAAGAECYATNNKVSPTLFVVVLPEGGNDIYTIVKQYVSQSLIPVLLTTCFASLVGETSRFVIASLSDVFQ